MPPAPPAPAAKLVQLEVVKKALEKDKVDLEYHVAKLKEEIEDIRWGGGQGVVRGVVMGMCGGTVGVCVGGGGLKDVMRLGESEHVIISSGSVQSSRGAPSRVSVRWSHPWRWFGVSLER